ncbi:MAG: hypothetical protein IID41_17505, partial [Planctomycetes bacterium]|nr:hypothetical protein [Planctomycetota bacterium]
TDIENDVGYIVLSTTESLWANLIKFLDSGNYTYVLLEGGYRMRDGAGFVTEASILVRPSVASVLVRGGWIDAQQESVMHLHSINNQGWYRAELIFFDRSIPNLNLGWLHQTSEIEALGNPDYVGMEAFTRILEDWHANIVADYENELRDKTLIAQPPRSMS